MTKEKDLVHLILRVFVNVKKLNVFPFVWKWPPDDGYFYGDVDLSSKDY